MSGAIDAGIVKNRQIIRTIKSKITPITAKKPAVDRVSIKLSDTHDLSALYCLAIHHNARTQTITPIKHKTVSQILKT